MGPPTDRNRFSPPSAGAPMAGGASAADSRLLALDGLRGAAAVLVVLYHDQRWFAQEPFLGHAYLAVDFFFVLSGFVVARAYERRLRAGMGFGRFMALRLRRLWPLILLGSVTGAVYLGLKIHTGELHMAPMRLAAAFGLSLLLVPDLHQPGAGAFLFPLDFPIWSLAFELVANAAYAGLIWRLSGPRLTALVAAAVLALVFVAAREGGLDLGSQHGQVLSGLARTAAPFLAGVLLNHLGPRLRRIALPGWVGALILLAVLATPVPSALSLAFDLVCALVLFPALVAGCAMPRPSGLGARLCAWSGELSYPLYVLHAPLSFLLGFAARKLAMWGGHPSPAFGLGAMLAVGLGAAAALLGFDRPVRRLLSDGWVRRPARLA